MTASLVAVLAQLPMLLGILAAGLSLGSPLLLPGSENSGSGGCPSGGVRLSR